MVDVFSQSLFLAVSSSGSRCQWQRDLSRGSAVAWGFESRRGHVGMSVSCECCVLSCRGLSEGSITRSESYRLWLSECD
jgi:hypothetical protein